MGYLLGFEIELDIVMTMMAMKQLLSIAAYVEQHGPSMLAG